MKPATRIGVLTLEWLVSVALSALVCGTLSAQVPAWVSSPLPMPFSTTPEAQRAAMNNVRSRVDSLKDAALRANRYAAGAEVPVWQAYRAVYAEFLGFTRTLTPQQASAGANELAELTEGLNIIGEAFANLRDDLASGRPSAQALADLCYIVRKATDVWVAQFNKDCTWLRVGAVRP